MRTTSSARRKRGADEVYQCVAHSLEHPIYFVAIETSERGSKNKKKNNRTLADVAAYHRECTSLGSLASPGSDRIRYRNISATRSKSKLQSQ